MIKKITHYMLLALIVFANLLNFAATQVHAAPGDVVDPKQQACEALGGASGASGDCDDPAAGPNIDNTLKLAINVFSLVVGIAAIIMIIVGGLKYIISQGDSNNINSAKNTILYAIIGLVVVALAQIIVKFVLTRSASTPSTPSTQNAPNTPNAP